MQVAQPVAPRQFQSIQYLRALAALGVVIFHASPAEHPFMVGNAGVDIFFVISGFIMWSITEERPASPAAFLKDRLIRIAPLYWLLTTLLVVGALVVPKLFPNLRIDLPYVAGSFLFVPMRPPGSTGADPIWPVLVQGWTLNYEMFFYVLFSLCLFLRPSLRLAAISLTLLCCVMAGPVLRRQQRTRALVHGPDISRVPGRHSPGCLPAARPVAFERLGIWVYCARRHRVAGLRHDISDAAAASGLGPSGGAAGGRRARPRNNGPNPATAMASADRRFLVFALSDPRSRHFRTRKDHDAVVVVFRCRHTRRGRRRHLLLVPDGTAGDGVSQAIARQPASRSIRPPGAVIQNLI